MDELLSDADIGLGEAPAAAPAPKPVAQKQPVVSRKTSALPQNNASGLLSDSDIGLGDGTPPAMGQIGAVGGQNIGEYQPPNPDKNPPKPAL